MTDQPTPPSPINRRHLFRGGAVLAGAAGATALGAAVGSTPAAASDNDPFWIGRANNTTSPTSLSIGSSRRPALVVSNPGGPALSLPPVGESWDGQLAVGEIASTAVGPVVGADFGDGAESVYLATSRNLADLPMTFSVRPVRVMDLRTKTRPPSIIQTSEAALDSRQRLKAGAWMDVAIAPAGEGFIYVSAFANVSVYSPVRAGELLVYPPGDRPGTTTVNFQAKRDISNGLFVSLEVVEGYYALRIWTSATTHVVLDLTGVVMAVDNSRSDTTVTRSSLRHGRTDPAELLAKVNAALAKNAG